MLMNRQSRIFLKKLKALAKFKTHLSTMKGTGIDAHQFRFCANSTLSECYPIEFLNLNELSSYVSEQVLKDKEYCYDKHMKSFFRNDWSKMKKDWTKVDHEAPNKLHNFKQTVKDNQDIIVVISPLQYRLLKMSDLPAISKIITMCISDSDTVLGNVYLLINSKISGYKINQSCGVSQSTISQLRQGKRDIENLSYKTIVSLVDCAENSSLSKQIYKKGIQAQKKIYQSV